MVNHFTYAQDTTRATWGRVFAEHNVPPMFGTDGLGLTTLLLNTDAHPTASIMFVPTTYTYTQGKLPVFCALEDRIWRRTGLGMQFRLQDRPMGFK